MPTEPSRLTFVATKDVDALLARAKKDLFYDRTRSAMIRELIMAGLNALGEKSEKEPRCESVSEEEAALLPCNLSPNMLD